ncbi:Pur family transcription activator [Endozoicomonas sp. SCSIO W0465]|uniref:Pur family transcription activator n=1 Tax=Endozoicomonas sp. SCSIO W0465 TaxID=2918516 RepID=UPI0020755E64|nr:Pur family transcription activator [Endozoicomonas sp. SCSIO W0465]USE34529.1 Pur family transcription activator [Endozoicomonas sp. SCSIO W0465]
MNGQQVTPEAVVKDYPDSPEGKLGIARFKAECCLKGLALNGQQVIPDAVVKDFPESLEGKLGMARFKELCCLRGLALHGQQVTPDAVVKDYQAARSVLDLARFKEQCCLRGLPLHGRQIIPDAVVKDYERGGWLLEKAIFYSRLALNARELNSGYLDNQKVLEAFNDVPGDHSSRQAEYLMERLKQPQRYDETDDTQDTIQQTWQILNSVSIKNDEQRRLQCILKFMAMQYQLLIDHQSVSAEAVWQTITTLRSSFQNVRLQFFFLTQCYITNRSVDGRQIHKSQILKCLQSFPEGSKLRYALSRWFDRCSAEANIMDELLFKRANAVPGRDNDRSNSHAVYSVNSEKEKAVSASIPWATTISPAQNLTRVLKQALKIGTPFFPDQQVTQCNALTLKTLEIIQEINGCYTGPPIVITGSYARFLQNRCPSFNDINIICATEVAARTLFDRLRALNTDGDADIPKRILIWPMHGCQEIKLPKAYNVVLREGDFATKAMELQVSVDSRVIHGNVERLSVHVPGVEKSVCCLSFAEETRLLNDTLKHLVDNLVLLTKQLQKGRVLNIPQTILFNLPSTTEECIYGLLMRSLLTLHKAKQFIALYSEEKPDDWPDQLREQRHLYALTEELQWTLRSHAYRDGFEQSVNRWLSTTAHVNDYEIKRKGFIKVLLAMMCPEQGWVNSTQ